MWGRYADYADANFRSGFARDPEGRFWEMYIGCALLEAGKDLLPRSKRPRTGGQPDLCILENDRRVWIEAIAPDEGDGSEGPISLPGGYKRMFRGSPVRQIHLRISSALWKKTQRIQSYRQEGAISENDVSIVAIGAGKFGIYAGGLRLPLPVSTVFPIGDEFVRIDLGSNEIVDQGYQQSFEILREHGNAIPRTAFLDSRFEQISGLVWSRVSIGNMDRSQRPLTFVHNPLALEPLNRYWGVWDEEIEASRHHDSYILIDLLNG